jgi:DNA repair protein RadD
MYTPRDYQLQAVDSIWHYFASGNIGNPLVAMPTGTGKSIVIADFLRKIYSVYPNQRIMVVTHVKELIEQNYEKLKAHWPDAPAGIYSSGLGRRDTIFRIIFGGIASVVKRYQAFGKIDLLLVDEAHLISPNDATMYGLFIKGLKELNPQLKVIGYTATAWRLGSGKLEGSGLFTDTCFDITGMAAFNRLIDEGYLVPLVPRATTAMLDIDGVHMRSGEFVQGELQAAVDRPGITLAALREAMHLGSDRHSWLIFCTGVDHAIHTAKALTDLGIKCEAVHGSTPTVERKRILDDFKSGKLRAVANNNVLTTGFDHPALDMIVMLRPTASPILWVQMLGRGTRPFFAEGPYDLSTIQGRLEAITASQKQNCLCLDFAGNTKRLGAINDPVIPTRKGAGKGEAPVKLCDQCATWNHASLRVCFMCGCPFPLPAVKIQASASTADLIRRDEPVVEVFKIDLVTYEIYEKMGKPPMLKVLYYSGLRRFNEFVCLQHDGFALRKAKEWWRERSSLSVPPTTWDAISSASTLKAPTHIRVWINKQYPEILAHCYDGSAFGHESPSNVVPSIEVKNVLSPPIQTQFKAASYNAEDDDIPF